MSQHIVDEDSSVRKPYLINLSVQGRFFRTDDDPVSSFSDREMKFVYNSAIDNLPTNANLALWYRGQVSAQWVLYTIPQACPKQV